MNINRKHLIIAASTVAAGVTWQTLDIGLPHVPALNRSETAAVNIPVVQQSWPAARLVVAEGIVRTRATSSRKVGPCSDNRAVDIVATVQFIAEPPTNGMDVDTWTPQVVINDMELDRDDGACSRVAHLFGRPTSSPDLDDKAVDAAVAAAEDCAPELIGALGGIDTVMGKALALWSIDPTGRTFVFTEPEPRCAWIKASIPSDPTVAPVAPIADEVAA